MLGKFFNARMNYSDVPWRYQFNGETESIERDGGWGESRVQYANELASSAHIFQEILIYPNRDMAIRSIESKKGTYPSVQFSDVPGELGTAEKLAADRAWFGCNVIREQRGLRVVVDKYCVTFTQYDTVVMEFSARIFSEPLLTIDEYLSLLVVLDRRVAKAFAASQ